MSRMVSLTVAPGMLEDLESSGGQLAGIFRFSALTA